jgi:hypothetical protein
LQKKSQLTSGGSQVTLPLDTSSQFIFKQVPPDSAYKKEILDKNQDNKYYH